MNSSRRETQQRAQQQMSGHAAAVAMGSTSGPTKPKSSVPNYAAQNRQRIKTLAAVSKAKTLDEENQKYLAQHRVNAYSGTSSRYNKVNNDSLHNSRNNNNKLRTQTPVIQASGNTPYVRPAGLGEVPKYLRQRQEEWRQVEAAHQQETEDERKKTELVLMREEDRQEHLRLLQVKKNDILVVLNTRMSLANDGEGARRRRIEQETQQHQLDKMITQQSSKKVYIRPNETV